MIPLPCLHSIRVSRQQADSVQQSCGNYHLVSTFTVYILNGRSTPIVCTFCTSVISGFQHLLTTICYNNC